MQLHKPVAAVAWAAYAAVHVAFAALFGPLCLARALADEMLAAY